MFFCCLCVLYNAFIILSSLGVANGRAYFCAFCRYFSASWAGPRSLAEQRKDALSRWSALIRETIYLHFPAPRLPYICILYAVKMDTALQTAFSVHAGFLLLHLFSYVINLLILLFVLLLGGYRPCCTKIETPFYRKGALSPCRRVPDRDWGDSVLDRNYGIW